MSTLLARWLLTAVTLVVLSLPAQAQERFFTESSSRGLQNAKLEARVSSAENVNTSQDTSITTLSSEMNTLESTSASCTADEKLYWTGAAWDCRSETDPTVSSWAKDSVGNCTAGQVLSMSGGSLTCTSISGSSYETDPFVQAFAHTNNAISACSSGELLTAYTSGSDVLIQCTTVGSYVTGAEQDPNVEDFAKSSLPSCGVGEVLKADGTNFSCVSDAGSSASEFTLDGLSNVNTTGKASGNIITWDGSNWVDGSEADPNVSAFAKSTLPTCSASEMLTGDGTNLSCSDVASAALGGIALGGLSDVTLTSPSSAQILSYNGSGWVNAAETDPGVESFAKTTLPTCTSAQVLSGDGTNLSCTDAATAVGNNLNVGDLGDVTITAAANGEVLKFNGTAWVDATETDPTVETFAQTTLPTCTSNEVLTGNGTSLSCTDASTAAGSSALGDLTDVTITAAATNDFLYYNGSAWVDVTPANARTALGLAIGTDVQGYDADLAAIGALAKTDGNVIVGNGTAWVAESGATARTSLGLGTGDDVTFNSVSGDGSGLTGISADTVSAIGSNGQLTFNNSSTMAGASNLYWDETNDRLGVGLSSPNAKLHVRESGLFTNAGTDAGTSYVPTTPILTVTTDGNGTASAAFEDNAVFKVGIGGADTGNVTTEHFRVNLSGDVGIGTSNPNAKLEVAGAVSVTSLTVNGTAVTGGSDNLGDHTATQNIQLGSYYLSGDGDDEGIIVDSSGNVAIGKAVPNTRLDVSHSGANTGALRLGDVDTLSNDTGIYFRTSGTAYLGTSSAQGDVRIMSNTFGGYDEGITVKNGGNVGIGTTSPNATLDVAGTVSSTGAQVSGTGYFDTLYVNGAAVTGGGATPSGAAGSIQFSDGSALASDNSNLYWDDTNNWLGIGTSSPAYALDIQQSGTTNTSGIRALQPSLSMGGKLHLGLGTAYSNYDSGFLTFNNAGGAGSANNYLSFSMYGVADILNLTGSGNVGIGTASPNAKLEVAGAVSVSSLTVNGTSITGGASAINDLSDVTVSSPANGAFLRYDGSEWIDVSSTSVVSTTTMQASWPDAVVCTAGSDDEVFYLVGVGSVATYRKITSSGESRVQFALSGAYSTHSGAGSYDCVTSSKSIATLYSEGKAYNFIGNNGASTNLTEIGDVNTSGVATNDILAFDGTNWVVSQTTVATGAVALSGLTDTNITTPANGAFLRYDGSEWTDVSATSVVSTTTMSAGFPDVISCFNSQGEPWYYYSIGETDGSDEFAYYPIWSTSYYVRISKTTNQITTNAGSSPPTGCSVGTSVASLYSNGQAFNFIGNNGASTNLTEVGDVNTSGVATNDILAFDGTNWVVSQTTVATGSTINEVNDIGDVTITSANTGDLLTWNGTAWVNQTVTDTVSTTTMVSGWPDAIRCDSGSVEKTLYLISIHSNGSNAFYKYPHESANLDLSFSDLSTAGDDDGTLSGYDCDNKTIAELYGAGKAFNFIGNNGASVNLNEIGDVSTTGAATNDILAFDGTNWVVSQTTVATGSTINEVNDIGDVTITSANTGDLLTWNGTAWVNQTVNDTVSTTTMISGWPDAIKCVNGTTTRTIYPYSNTSGGSVQYHTAISNPSGYFRVIFNSDGSYSSQTNMSGYSCLSKSISTLYSEGLAFNFIGNNGASTNLNEIGDVSTTGATTNDILAFDGTNWVVSQTTVATGSTINEVNDIGDVTITSANTGDLLTWNGSAWVNQTVTDTVSTTTMTAAWPDAILCEGTGAQAGLRTFFYQYIGSSGTVSYRMPFNNTGDAHLYYNSDGTYNSGSSNGWSLDCHGSSLSISQLYAAGQAFNFIGNNGASTNLNEIGDVSTTGAATNDILAFDGTNWVVSQTTVATGSTINEVNDIGDVTITSANTGDLLSWNGTAWVNQTVTDTVSTTTMMSTWPDAIRCVNSSGHGMVLHPSYTPHGTTGRYHYSNVISNTYHGNYGMVFNADQSFYGFENFTSTDCNGKSIATLYSEGKAFNFIGNNGASVNLNEIGDVSTTGATTNDILAFDGTNWVVSQTTVATGSTINEVNDIGDVTITSANTGDLLSWNGTAWVNQTVTDTVSTTTMMTSWPDAIKCNVTSPAWGERILYLGSKNGSTYQYMEPYAGGSVGAYVNYSSSGSFSAYGGAYTTTDCNVSISTLYSNGQAFNFIGNNGSSADQWDFDELSDSMTLDATTSIATGSYDLNIDSGTLFVDGDADNVGVGTTTPDADAKLDVAGAVKVSASGSETCDGDLTGAIRFVSGQLQVCTQN